MNNQRGPSGPERRGGPGSRRGLPARRPGGGRPDPAGAEDVPSTSAREQLRQAAAAGASRPLPTVVVRGTLRRAEVEMRPLVLDGDDGTTWELLLPPGWAVEAEPGARVTVSGDPADDVVTTSMVGPVLRVRTLSTEA
ncbi:hypothetical protein [Terrabacter terrigena]|uniref:Uncharacterized protein n=1 Tax=Terrabacter terrigena TaxID=574718 RepID=A0ABW3MWL7_9MICO